MLEEIKEEEERDHNLGEATPDFIKAKKLSKLPNLSGFF